MSARYRAAPDARPYGPAGEGTRAQLAYLRLRAGDTAAAWSLADTAVARAAADFDRGGEDPLPAVEAAALHAFRGHTDAAMEWLRHAHDISWKDYRYLRLDPFFTPLRGKAEFTALLGRMEEETAVLRQRAMETSPAVFRRGMTALR